MSQTQGPRRTRVPATFVVCPPLARGMMKRPLSDAQQAKLEERRARKQRKRAA